MRTFRISRNVAGDEPNTFSFYRDGLYFGRFYNPNLAGGQPNGGSEAKGPCDSMSSVFEAMDRQLSVGSGWTDWDNAYRWGDSNTKWWYTDKTDNPPKWWVFHCPTSPNCPNS